MKYLYIVRREWHIMIKPFTLRKAGVNLIAVERLDVVYLGACDSEAACLHAIQKFYLRHA